MPDSNSNPPEGFRVIPGYPRYAIDKNGTILSICSRNGKGKDRSWDKATRVRLQKDKAGYHIVSLCRDGQQLTTKVHHVVLLTFVGARPDGMECRHLDGNRVNNHVLNLAWGTPTENSNDRALHGTMPKGEKCFNAKLTEDDVIEIRKRAANGETKKDINKDFPVDRSTISRIVNRLKWKHV